MYTDLWIPDLGEIDLACPINWESPLMDGLKSRYLAVPNLTGGNIFYDIAGFYNGTLTNTPAWSPDSRPGGFKSLKFVGASSQYVSIPEAMFPNTEDFSVSIWVNATAWTNNSHPFGKGSAFGISEFAFWVTSTPTINFLLGKDAGNWHITTAVQDTGMATATWYHYLASKTGTDARLYRNGISVDSSTLAVSTRYLDSNLASIGAGQNVGPVGYFDGYVDDVCIWDRGLTAGEAWAFYHDSLVSHPATINFMPLDYFRTQDATGNRRRRVLLGAA